MLRLRVERGEMDYKKLARMLRRCVEPTFDSFAQAGMICLLAGQETMAL
jgi:hypothetical protein